MQAQCSACCLALEALILLVIFTIIQHLPRNWSLIRGGHEEVGSHSILVKQKLDIRTRY